MHQNNYRPTGTVIWQFSQQLNLNSGRNGASFSIKAFSGCTDPYLPGHFRVANNVATDAICRYIPGNPCCTKIRRQLIYSQLYIHCKSYTSINLKKQEISFITKLTMQYHLPLQMFLGRNKDKKVIILSQNSSTQPQGNRCTMKLFTRKSIYLWLMNECVEATAHVIIGHTRLVK